MKNLQYKQYSSEEFADDKDFWLWVLEEDTNQNDFWVNFLKDNPGKAKEIAAAREVVLQVNAGKHKLEENKVNTLWERIQGSTDVPRSIDNTVPLTEYKKARG